MPKLIIRYKDKKVKMALMDLSKYLHFSIVSQKHIKKVPGKKNADVDLLEQIEKDLKDLKDIKNKKAGGITIKDMLNEE